MRTPPRATAASHRSAPPLLPLPGASTAQPWCSSPRPCRWLATTGPPTSTPQRHPACGLHEVTTCSVRAASSWPSHPSGGLRVAGLRAAHCSVTWSAPSPSPVRPAVQRGHVAPPTRASARPLPRSSTLHHTSGPSPPPLPRRLRFKKPPDAAALSSPFLSLAILRARPSEPPLVLPRSSRS
jgi:hypothetical protein